MKFPIIAAIIIIVILIFTFSRESFDDRAIAAGIRDMVDSKMNIIQYRAKYGSDVSSLKVNYLISAYKAGQLTPEKVREIMSL